MSTVTELSLAFDITLDMQKPFGFLDAGGRHDAGHFGIDSMGRAYVDTSGASPGDTASLVWDGAVGRFCLDSWSTGGDDLPAMLFLSLSPGSIGGIGHPRMPWTLNNTLQPNCGPGINRTPFQLTGHVEPGCVGTARWPR